MEAQGREAPNKWQRFSAKAKRSSEHRTRTRKRARRIKWIKYYGCGKPKQRNEGNERRTKRVQAGSERTQKGK
jgi:hypothetical protein